MRVGAVGDLNACAVPLLTVTAGAVVSITVMTCARLVLLPQPSLAVQVRVMMLVQPTVLVTVVTLGVIGPWQASKIGRASCRERVEISVVAVSLKKKVTAGAVVSITVITCARWVLLRQPR